MSERPRFHLAFPVHDLSQARAFYGDLLGCPEGRSSDDWVDFDFFGHQIVAHLSPNEVGHKAHNDVDGDQVPVRHFGTILSMTEWKRLAARLTERKVEFIIEPGIRFEQLMSVAVSRGAYPDAVGREAEWLVDRMTEHRKLSGTSIQRGSTSAAR